MFIRRELGRPAWPLLLFYLALFASLAAVVWAAWWSWSTYFLRDVLGPIGIGVVGMLALVPLHEWIHGVAYRAVGAPVVVYGAAWKRLIFHASAPHFVASAGRLGFVAMAPFVALSAAMVTLCLVTEGPLRLGVAVALLMHTQGCSGDFCMLNFMWRVRRQGSWCTFDELTAGAFQLWCRPAPRLV